MTETEKTWLCRLRDSPNDVALRAEYSEWLDKRRHTNKALLLKLAIEEAELTKLSGDLDGHGLTCEQRDRSYEIRDAILHVSHKIDSHWIVEIDPALSIPAGLTELGLRAAKTIIDFLADEGWTYERSGRAFWSPAEFDGGSKHAVLVVRHINELLDNSLNLCTKDEALQNRLSERLDKIGVWSELKDEWTSLIYPSDYGGTAIGIYWL